MSWNKIDKSWNEFAEFHKVELLYNERNLFNAIECIYKVDLNNEQYSSLFLGILWKTQSGHNRNRTIISIEFKTTKKLNNLNITKRRISNLFSKNLQTEFEKNISKDLTALNGKNLILKGNRLEIELNKIISSKLEFEKAIALINKITLSN